MKRKRIKTPNGILYFILYILIYPLLKILFRLKVDRSDYEPPKGAFIVVSNHESFMDFLLAMLTVYPRRLNAVAAQKFFFRKPLDKLLPMMGCIPKNLFESDARSVIGMISVIKRGGRLLLFPEGRCSTDGTYAGMHKATGKLIKKLGVPVVSCHIEGSYICMPLWRKGFRFGRLRVTLANLLAAEDAQTLGVDEINRRIDERLSGADTLPPKKPFCVFRAKRLAEGIENVFYYCPNCRSEFTLVTEGNTIRCTACDSSATMDRNGKLTPKQEGSLPETAREWYMAQIAHEMLSLNCVIPSNCEKHENRQLSPSPVLCQPTSALSQSADFVSGRMKPIRTRVLLRTSSTANGGLESSDRGELSLDYRGWHYDGELRGEKTKLFFPLATVPAIPFDPNLNFQIYAKGKYFAFTPEDEPKACVKYAILGECAYHSFVSDIAITKNVGIPK